MEDLEGKIKTFLSGLDGKRATLEKETREAAISLLREYFRQLRSNLGYTPKVEDLFPVTPEVIIEQILGADYLELETIPPDSYAAIMVGDSMSEIAGLVDRVRNIIIVANKFKPESKRFTAAHEIGHWLLHSNMLSLREVRVKRSFVERQADLFAAELLMPTFHVVKTFFQYFGEPIEGTKPNEELAFWLSAGSKKEFDAIDFSMWTRRSRSRLIAQVSSFKTKHFHSLAARYGVSITTMAIQLEDLGLVK